MYLLVRTYWATTFLSGGFSLGWAKAGIAILRDPDQKDMVGTLYPSALCTPKGFELGPLMAEIWAFFQILGDFQFILFWGYK